jgi:putative tricarboxylic transport membrane protein
MDVPGNTGDEAAATRGGLATRWVELVFALLMLVVGGIVIFDSARIGAQWGSDGPQAGYFPMLTGSALSLAGGWLAATTLLRWKARADEVFVSWERLKPVLAMLLPTIAYVVVIAFLGIYVASAIFIGAFMVWQGRYRLLPAVGIGVAIPAVMFALFELWFLVPLPKGPLERMLGY